MILAVYNPSIYKEYFLPNSMDVDYDLVLERSLFGISENISLKMEVTREGWFLYQNTGYSFTDGNQESDRRSMSDHPIIAIQTEHQEILQIFTAVNVPTFQILGKYSLRGKQEISIGKAPHNIVVYDFQQLVSGSHAAIRLHEDGFYIEDFSANGIFESSRRLRGSKKLQIGDHIIIFGLHIIFLGDGVAIGSNYGSLTVRDGFLEPYPVVAIEEGAKRTRPDKEEPDYFKRSPRNLPQICTDQVEIEAPPAPQEEKKRPLILTIGPSFTMALPMMLGCLLAVYGSYSSGRSAGVYMFTGLITAVSAAILGVVWALVNLRYSRQESQEAERQRFNAYSNYLIRIADTLKEKYAQNTGALHQIYPSAAACLAYDRKNAALWNRNVNHEDFLYCRLGIGDIPFQMEISIPKEKFTLQDDSLREKPAMLLEEYRLLRGVPVGIDLAKNHLIGLVGGAGRAGAIQIMHILAAEIAANNCYTDVKMAFIYRAKNSAEAREWECMKWFPHVWSADRSTRYMAADEIEAGDLFFELSNIIRMRSQSEDAVGKPHPYYILFLSDPTLIEGELLAKYILEPQECYGLTTFLMVENIEELPNVCDEVLQNDSFFQGHYHLMDAFTNREAIRFDEVSAEGLDAMGRRLCGIEVNEEESTSEIPETLDFFEMYGVQNLEGLHVLDRWRKNRTYYSMKALIGRKAGGADCFLDIHEKYHGPHGLIAGTTGSGKSETLQTYMLSMAINFSPDDVSFFVIDFKGGGMADLFSNLPHMVGQISNLSGNQVRRAMISIKSENTRRQRLFRECGVNNINLYTRLFKNGEAKIPIPHLFIIIDEFAELKREEPEFMQELISVAQVGRSLGVHLFLATQKPSGTVDDNIWSNAKFRLCLRVQDRQDSNDMLHRPDAAFLTQAGRCYLQVGNDEIYELFQSGWSGAPYNEDGDGGEQTTAAILTRTGKTSIVGNFHRRARQLLQEAGNVHEKTQLEAVVEYLSKIAAENGYRQNMQLWLPVLPSEILLHALPGRTESGFSCNKKWGTVFDEAGRWQLKVCLGLLDDPVNQSQEPLQKNFATDGHLAVCGTVASGKSTFLQTLVWDLINQYSPEEVNIYCLDFSGKLMAPFEEAPHVGGVIFDDEIEKAGKFFHMLARMLEERKKLFRGGNYSQYVQAYGLTLPAIVIVIDNYANFTEKTGGAFDSMMMMVAREGVGHGIFLAVSGAGFGVSEIPGRIADNIRTIVTLEMGDKFKYMEILRTTKLAVYPETGVRGRGLTVEDGRVLEFQTALCLEAEDAFERSSRISALCREMAGVWKGVSAQRIPFIPDQPVLSQLIELPQYQSAIQDPRHLPVAYCRSDASVYSIGLNTTYCYTVSGKSHTGRTNVLKLAAAAAYAKGAKIAIFEPEGTKLLKTATEYGAEYIRDSKEAFEYFQKLIPEFVERNREKHAYEEEGMDEETIFDRMSVHTPIFLIIADLLRFFRIVYAPQEGVGNIHSFMETILEKGRLHHIYLIGATRPEDSAESATYRGFNLFTSYKAGMHLGGNYSAQRIFHFQNIPYQEQGKMQKRGLGAAADAEDETIAINIVLPLVK